jgi:hypothetical protein
MFVLFVCRDMRPRAHSTDCLCTQTSLPGRAAVKAFDRRRRRKV